MTYSNSQDAVSAFRSSPTQCETSFNRCLFIGVEIYLCRFKKDWWKSDIWSQPEQIIHLIHPEILNSFFDWFIQNPSTNVGT